MADQAVPPRCLGTVSAKRKAFGFIRAAKFPMDIYFHSASCSSFAELATGDAVEFQVEQQPGGKKAAVAVCKAKIAAPVLHSVDSTPYVGLVATDTGASQQSSGYLRYMDQRASVQHLTFSAQDLAAGVTSVARGQLVQFQVLTDHRKQQLQQAKEAATSGCSKHAFMRATQLRPLRAEEEALLTPLQQKQLQVLEALADTFDFPASETGT